MTTMRHEEPLVRLSKSDENDLSVSPVVNTQVYHDAFDRLPLRKSVCESAYKQAGRILNATNGTEKEYLVAISSRTGALIADNLDAPTSAYRKTGFRDSDMAKIMGQEDGVVLIHNHPMSLPPSYRDVLTTAENPRVEASLVVGHDGSLWYFSVKDHSVAESLEELYNSAKDARGNRAEYFALKTLQESSSKKVLDWRRLR